MTAERLAPGEEARIPGYPAVRVHRTDPVWSVRVHRYDTWELVHLEQTLLQGGGWQPVGDTGLEVAANLTELVGTMWLRPQRGDDLGQDPAEQAGGDKVHPGGDPERGRAEAHPGDDQ